jgi:hypothetical protein
VVSRPSGNSARQSAALSHRHGGLRRRTPSEPQLTSFGHVRPYSRGQKNDFRGAEAIAEAVQRPTMKFVATKTAEQPDLHAGAPPRA